MKRKVKIKNLPNGYKVKGGQIVKVMATGGVPYGSSIGSIPRDYANVEAEKNETALTDLNDDGNFELYNIGGKRHPDGGTPLSLPPQSFIFSDTAKMKLNKEQLKNFGITSKKKMTPAAVSKKFPLNKYYAMLENEFSDNISNKTAELMLDKNKMELSHLAFVSESKKKFEDGVPLAAYPYLMSKNIDPQQFSQKVQGINEQQANMQMIDQLPPEKQQQVLAMQDFMKKANQGPPQGGSQGGMPPMGPPPGGGMPPQGMMAQTGNGENDAINQGLMRPLGLPSQRLEEVNQLAPFNKQDFTSDYPTVSYPQYASGYPKGINQGSLLALADKLLLAQPDSMEDKRYKEDDQADYAKYGGDLRRAQSQIGTYKGESLYKHPMMGTEDHGLVEGKNYFIDPTTGMPIFGYNPDGSPMMVSPNILGIEWYMARGLNPYPPIWG